jgi:hypothetical protein
MTSWAEELRTRLKAKHHEWEKYKEQVRAAKERELKAREEFSALQLLLHSEQPKKAADSQAAVPLPIASETNKADVIRLLIQEHGANGLVPAQIRKLLEANQVHMPTNYLYAVLLRAKKANRIVERNGKYYPIENKQQAAS